MNKDHGRLLRIILKSLAALVVTFVIVYAFISGEAIYRWAKQKFFPNTARDTALEDAAKNAQRDELYRQFSNNNWLYYPRLGISAPVQWNIPQDKANGLLPQGLVHISDSATPDQNGDIIIAGHSSYFWWVKGDYKTALVTLPGAKAGDIIVIRKDKIYLYEVVSTSEIGGDDPLNFAIKGSTKGNLYLTTCVPIGTDLHRLIVTAKFTEEI